VTRLLILLLALCLQGWASQARADDNRPLTVRIVEEAPDDFRVTWKVPANIEQRLLPALKAPGGCAAGRNVRLWSDPLGHWREERWRCPDGLAGSAIVIAYPAANPGLATIARLQFAGTDEQTLLLQPQQVRVAIPAGAESHGVFLDFLKLGVEHIWLGFDHLLFVAGLLFIAGTPRRVLATITGFTAAHSVTLALSALDVVRLPTSAVEGVIALSIVFLAVEIVKGPRQTLTWRHPTAVAGSFGLLHGFGFAAVLREVGLPEDGLVTALFAFNLGIEVGQVLFVGLLMALMLGIRRLPRPTAMNPALQRAAGYAVGILASFWMFERLTA